MAKLSRDTGGAGRVPDFVGKALGVMIKGVQMMI